MRKRHPVYQLPDQPDLFAISRWEDIRYVSSHPEIFTSDRSRSALLGTDVDVMIGSSTLVVTETDGEEHKRKRAMAFQAVKPGRLVTYEPMIAQLVDRLIDGFAPRGRADLVDELTGPLPAYVTCHMLGLPEEDVDYIREWGTFEVPGLRWYSEDFARRQLASAARMNRYLTAKVLDRHEHPGDDVISDVIAEQIAQDGEFDLAEARSQVTVLLGGGVITTAHFLSTAICNTLASQGVLERVSADHALIPTLIEEALRLETPSLWHTRRVLVDTELHGLRIPAGAFVLLMTAAANRSENRFPNPDVLDIDRPNLKHHVGFGYGAHFCLGAPLARLEVRIAFEHLLTRLPNLRLANDNDFKHIASVQFRGLRRLNVEFDPAPTVCGDRG
jgi:cytochrome P450